jgi:hypothetical protein
MRFLSLILLGAGAVAIIYGYQERSVSEGATAEPLQIELAAIENGEVPENPHLEIGPHWRLYHELVFNYEDKGGDPNALPDNTKINFTYFPVISFEHPHVREVDQLEKLYGSLEEIPDDRYPRLRNFAMLVKTRSYSRYGDLPDGQWYPAEGQTGMVINKISSIGRDERALIQESFPELDLGTVLILQAGRTPSSEMAAMGWMGGGGVAIIVGIGLFFVRRPQKMNLDGLDGEPARIQWVGDRLKLSSCHGLDDSDCWLCGRQNDQQPLAREFHYTPPLYFVAILLGLLPGLIVAVMGRRKVSLALPICGDCDQSWKGSERLATLFGLLGLFGLPILFCVVLNLIDPEIALFGIPAGLAAWLIGLVVLKMRADAVQAKCVSIENGEATLTFPRPEITRPLVRQLG